MGRKKLAMRKISQICAKSIELRCNDILLIKDDVSNSKSAIALDYLKHLSVLHQNLKSTREQQYLSFAWSVLVKYLRFFPSIQVLATWTSTRVYPFRVVVITWRCWAGVGARERRGGSRCLTFIRLPVALREILNEWETRETTERASERERTRAIHDEDIKHAYETTHFIQVAVPFLIRAFFLSLAHPQHYALTIQQKHDAG